MKKFYNMFKTFACLTLCLMILANTSGIGNINKGAMNDPGASIILGADDPCVIYERAGLSGGGPK